MCTCIQNTYIKERENYVSIQSAHVYIYLFFWSRHKQINALIHVIYVLIAAHAAPAVMSSLCHSMTMFPY